ncbi:MAG: sel1 repeat family protein [Prevotella sp.]|nr:sel1 repeat family protein [Prevotella sp.]
MLHLLVDSREAVKWYQKSVEHDYAIAQYLLGLCYDHGEVVEQNIDEAVKWYRKAAEQGHQPAKEVLKSMGLGGK